MDLLGSRRLRKPQVIDVVGDCGESTCSTRGSDMVHPRIRPFNFTHRDNEDGTIDSMCESCFLAVARAVKKGELEQMELRHVCQPVERRKLIRTVHRVFSYHVKV